MINGTYGIFRGGEVTINPAFFGIDVGPTILRTQDGRNVGFGQGYRRITVRFNQPVSTFQFFATRPSNLDAPIYGLDIGPNAGAAYIAFDSLVTNDIVLISQPTTGYVTMAKVTWPANCSRMDQLALDFEERHESRILIAPNPMNPGDLYSPGMDFGDVSFNEPLIGMSVLSEVLQGELKSRSGDRFSVVLIQREDIVGLGQRLTIAPFKVLMRYVGDGGPEDDHFKIISTRTESVFTYDVAAIIGQRINIYVNPDTGVVGSATTYSEDLGILVSYGDVPLNASGLQDVRFILATEISQANAQAGAEIELFRSAIPSGFAAPLSVQPSTVVPNTVSVGKNVAVLNGIQFNVPVQQIALPEAPLAGDRMDLLFLEVWRVVEATPTTDGSFYVPLAGVGYLSTKVRLVVAPGVQYGLPEDAMRDSAVVGIGGGNYVRHSLGHYRSAYTGSYDGESWALPIALFYRFNRDPWSYANLTGGGAGRPDGKRHNFLSVDEMEIIGPIIPFKGVNHQALYGAALDMILRGSHSGQMGASSLVPTYYSKRPVHVDAISPTAVPGARMMGAPDRLRRQWSAMPSPYWVGSSFTANMDHSDEVAQYEDGTHTITIKSPVDGEIWIGEMSGDQPIVELTWVETGIPVALAGPWVMGVDRSAAAAMLDTAAPGYDPFGTISISYMVVQHPVNYLGHVPTEVYGAYLNGNPVILANAKEEMEAVVTDGGLNGMIIPIGSYELKGEALRVEATYTADGTDALKIPTEIEGRRVLGVLVAEVVGGPMLAIKTMRLGATEHTVVLETTVPNGTQVKLQVMLGGVIVNYRPKNLSLDEFAEGTIVEMNINGAVPQYLIPLPAGRVLKGAMGFVHEMGQPLVGGVYLDGRLYTATFGGFDRNLVRVTLTLSPIAYAALEPAEQGKWELNGDGTYWLKDGVYSLKIALLWSAALSSFDVFSVVYQHASLPFIPVKGGEVFTLAHHGMMIGSSASIANESDSYLSPLTEKFPLVRGKLKGAGNPSPQTTIQDLLQVGQLGAMPFDGTSFGVDGSLKFNIGVMAPDGGFFAWVALVKVDGALRVLTYVVEGDTFDVASNARAFLSYPSTHYVE